MMNELYDLWIMECRHKRVSSSVGHMSFAVCTCYEQLPVYSFDGYLFSTPNVISYFGRPLIPAVMTSPGLTAETPSGVPVKIKSPSSKVKIVEMCEMRVGIEKIMSLDWRAKMRENDKQREEI